MPAKQAVLVRGARQLVTLRGPQRPRRGTALGELGIIHDGAMLVRDGRIVAVGQGRRVENLADARSATEIDATGKVVLPGFVDSHTQPAPWLLQIPAFGAAGRRPHSEQRAGGGLDAGNRAARMTPARTLERQVRRRLALFVRHGTTTLEAKTDAGLDKWTALKTLRVLAKLDDSPLSIVSTVSLGWREALAPEESGRAEAPGGIVEMLPAIGRQRLARFIDVNCGRRGFRIEDARRALEAARQAGLGSKVHAEPLSPSAGVRLAVECGATSAANLEAAGEDDIAILAESATLATLLPGRAFYLGLERHSPARALIDRGAAVALATGFHVAAGPTCSMPMILTLACTQLAMTPAEAIAAATINGAHALGMADQVGSLEAGKLADFTLFDASDYREIPCQFGVNLAVLTVKRGVVLCRQGETA